MNKIALSLILFFCVILNTTIYSQIKKDKDAQKVYNSLKESKNNDTISKYSVKLSDYYLSKIFDPKTKPDYKDEYITLFLKIKNELILQAAKSGDRNCLWYASNNYRSWELNDKGQDSLQIVLKNLINTSTKESKKLKLDLAVAQFNSYIALRRANINDNPYRKNSYENINGYLDLITDHHQLNNNLDLLLELIKSNQKEFTTSHDLNINKSKYNIKPLILANERIELVPFVKNITGSDNKIDSVLQYCLYLVDSKDSVLVSSYTRCRYADNIKSYTFYDFLDLLKFTLNEIEATNSIASGSALGYSCLLENVKILKVGGFYELASNYLPTTTKDSPIIPYDIASDEFKTFYKYKKSKEIYSSMLFVYQNFYGKYNDNEFGILSKVLRCASIVKAPYSDALNALLYYRLLYEWQDLSKTYPEISKDKAIDSLSYYLSKDTSSVGLFLRGVTYYNGEFVSKNKELGVKLMKEAYKNGDMNATFLMRDILNGNELLKYYNFTYPWDFTLPCRRSKNMHIITQAFDARYDCPNFTQPEKLFLTPFNVSALKFNNKGVLIVPFFNNIDLEQTFDTWTKKIEYHNLYCSKSCITKAKQYKLDDNKAGDEYFNKTENQLVKCAACSKQMKRKDLITIEKCYCIKKDGTEIGVDWAEGIKVCSYDCEQAYCKSRCNHFGWNQK